MGEQQKHRRRPPRRFRRHSTKQRTPIRLPAHIGRLVAILLAVVAVIVLALIWGNALKEQSDAYRAAAEAGEWTVEPETATDTPATVPDMHLLEIKPEGNVGDIILENSHDGVLLPLQDAAGTVHYLSDTAAAAGVALAEGAVSLADDVARVSRRDLYVAGIFHVRFFEADGLAAQTYRRGLEAALLYEYAASGIDALLLVGLPVGDDAGDALTVAFLEELNALFSTLPDPPAVGVALPLSALEGEPDESGQAAYVGQLSPARVAAKADFLALDLRDFSAEEIDGVLPRLSYAYTRHHLWMMTDRGSDGISDDLISHGFTRLFEMKQDA